MSYRCSFSSSPKQVVKSAGEKFLFISPCFIHHFSPPFVIGEAACHFMTVYLESSVTRSLCFSVSQQKTESAINLQLFGKAISVVLSNFSLEYFIEQKQEERGEKKENVFTVQYRVDSHSLKYSHVQYTVYKWTAITIPLTDVF